MSGQGETITVRRPPQPGGRAPAPGRLALVQAFLNSHYDLEHDHGAELLGSPAAVVGWLQRAGLLTGPAEADDRDVGRALAVREGLRALAREGAGWPSGFDQAVRGAAVEVRATSAGELYFVAAPETGVAGALGVLVAIAALAVADGSWSRLKICPGHDCGWAFYDASRNRSGRWCSMSVCGGRAKARSHYHRRTSRV